MKKIILLLAFFVHTSVFAACLKPMIFFDLGQTLVDTDTNNYNPMFYLKLDAAKFTDARDYPTAKEYIDSLNNAGFKLGLIADIPEQWGVNYPAGAAIKDLATAKFQRLADFIAGIYPSDGSSWTGVPIDWSPFGTMTGDGVNRVFVGRILLPKNNTERKSSNSIVMYQRAMQIADSQHCPVLYMGENTHEMELADQAGMPTYQAGATEPKRFFLAPNQVADYVKNYKKGAWRPLQQ